MKICGKCGETKPAAQFSVDLSRRDGVHSQCKRCKNIAAAAYRMANRIANLEKWKAYAARYHVANAEKIRARVVKWAADNPEKYKVSHVIASQNRRARKRAVGGKLSKGLAERLFQLQRGKCACCKQPLGDDYHLDHVVPLALGGLNTDANIQLLRASCNLQKCATHPIDFMRQKGFLL